MNRDPPPRPAKALSASSRCRLFVSPPPLLISTLTPHSIQWLPLSLPPGAPIRMDFAKSLWDLEILDQSSWACMLSWLDMLTK